MITIRRVNQNKWDQAGGNLIKSGAAVEAKFQAIMRESVDEGAEALQGAIRGDDMRIALRMRQLDKAWARRKGSPTPLLNEGTYAESITPSHEPDGRSKIMAEGEHGDDLSNARLALILENGTRRMRPLPHWEPTQEFVLKRIRERLKEVRDVVRV